MTFDELLRALPEPTLIVTPAGKILAVNPAATRQCGPDLDGRSIAELAADNSGILSFLTTVRTSNEFLTTRIALRAGGPLLECGAAPLSADALLVRCTDPEAALQNHTAAVSRAEQMLRESEERYRTLIGATTDAIWTTDPQGSFNEPQPAWETQTGQQPDDYRGEGWLKAVHAEDRERVRGICAAALETGTPYEAEARIWHAMSQSYHHSILRGAPLRDTQGGIREWVGSVSDREEQRRLEEQLRQTQKLESLGVLAGGVAHDFNNLLVGILGNSSLALETISSNNPARGMLRDVIAASEGAAHLTRQLLAYAGKGRFVIEPLDLSDLVREISTLIQSSIPKGVHLRLELEEQLACVEGDASQIQQLIMNLVINGAEAIPDGSAGTVLVTTGEQEVDEEYILTTFAPAELTPGRYVSLQVHDSGIGMDEATVLKIFDPFFTTKFTGRGLGLAAAMGIVRGHKGAIKVYSMPSKGTTFKVLFPASAGQKPARRDVPESANRSGGEMILIVDDEGVVRRTAKSMLERYGYSVVLAENGQEGVDLFRVLREKIQLVLLDMTMPVLSGEETFRQLKALKPDVRVILSSGYNEVEAIRRFTGKGLAGFIQKPYSATALWEKVRSVIQERNSFEAGASGTGL